MQPVPVRVVEEGMSLEGAVPSLLPAAQPLGRVQHLEWETIKTERSSLFNPVISKLLVINYQMFLFFFVLLSSTEFCLVFLQPV